MIDMPYILCEFVLYVYYRLYNTLDVLCNIVLVAESTLLRGSRMCCRGSGLRVGGVDCIPKVFLLPLLRLYRMDVRFPPSKGVFDIQASAYRPRAAH